jgi:digeranylgeranylglycerophospholipid reductase
MTMIYKCDVLVVGAGPAGSSAARAAAQGGVKTIFIDKRKEVGVPVQCAEAIGSYLIPHLPFKIPKAQLLSKIDGVSFIIDDITLERTGGIWSGYAINREKFDKWLSESAIRAGAELHLESELIGFETSDNYTVTKVEIKTKYGHMKIKPKIIIAADGVDSKVLKLLGFKIDFKKTGYVYGIELGGLSINKPNFDHIFLGDFAPGGYGYVFPLSKSRANVGVGVLFRKDHVEKFYNNFLEQTEVKKLLNNKGHFIKEKKGLVPFLSQTEKLYYGNILLVGDVANQNIKPFVEGFQPSIICGNIAGQSAAAYIKHGGELESYPYDVKKKMNDFFKYSDILGKIAYKMGLSTEKKYHLIRAGLSSDIFSIEEIRHLKKLDFLDIKELLLKRYNKSIGL